MKYRSEIDGLRALAVLPVILFHAGFEWFSGGFVGVDVFFVISGYLITTIIISEMAEGRFSIINFYERRARRILPALFFVMAACVPFAWLWLTPIDLKEFGQSLVAVSTFSSNILFWLGSGYFDTAAELKPLLHTWSLAVEEQYYILFPIFIMLTWKLGVKWVIIFLAVIFLTSLGFAQWAAYSKPSFAFFLLPTRIWELLAGVFVAFYLKYNLHFKSDVANQLLSLVGLSMIIYSIMIFDDKTPFPSFFTLIPVIGTSLLILCAVQRTLVHCVLSLKPIVGIGLISYSTYLWHQPLLAFARHRLSWDVSEVFLLFLCFVSLFMAWLSWRYIEKPFRDKAKIGRNAIFVSSLAAILGFSALGFYIHKIPIQINTSVTLSEVKIDIPIKFKGIIHNGTTCSFPTLYSNDDLCEISGEGKGNKIILIGDSHARVLSEVFYSSRLIFESLTDLSASGCPFLLDVDIYIGRKITCSNDYQLARKNILSQRPDNIVIYQARLPLYFYGDGFDNGKPGGKEIRPKLLVSDSLIGFDDDNETLFINSLRKSLKFIAQTNQSLFIILPSFSNGWNPTEMLISMEKNGLSFEEAKDFLSVPKELVNKRVSYLREFLVTLSKESDNITLIEPNEFFCSEVVCSPLNEYGELLFSDTDHFSLLTNNLILNKILNSLNEDSM
tara:strand:- start:8555 stop:10564 length:2010 start_codon:yes stop_codon:yes gene_type:complete